MLGYARDVTELKAYERQLETQRDNLEVLNQVVRHDIRNDLQLVLAYAETLEDVVDEAGREYVEQVLASARDAVSITETARDVAEVLLQADAEPTQMRLRYTLEHELDEVRSTYEHAVVTTEGTIPSVDVVGDDMLESVFRNLLTNAIEHNDAAIPEVTVSAGIEGDDVVRIVDNGSGIPTSARRRSSRRGRRASRATAPGWGCIWFGRSSTDTTARSGSRTELNTGPRTTERLPRVNPRAASSPFGSRSRRDR